MAVLGDGSGSGFPGVIDTIQTYTNVIVPDPDDSTRADAAFANDVLAAILALENNVAVKSAANTFTATQTILHTSPTLLALNHQTLTFTGSDTSSAITYLGTVGGSSTNHARGWNNILTVNGSVTYDMLAYNLTNNGTGEIGALIGGITLNAGGDGWGLDVGNTVPVGATNGNLSRTTGVRVFLDRRVAASGGGFDRGVVVENVGTVQGSLAAFDGMGFATGLSLIEGPGGDIGQYIFLRGANDLNILRVTRPGFADIQLASLGQALYITTADAGFSATANLKVNGIIESITSAPSFVLTDTTASAKSLTIAVDANVAAIRESAGTATSLIWLDLANNLVRIGALTQVTPATFTGRLHVSGATQTTLESLGGIELTVADGYAIKMQGISASGAALAWGVRNASATWTEIMRLDPPGNLPLAATAAGTSGVGVLGIGIGTQPTTSPANIIQLYAKDSSVGSANATLAFRTEQAVEVIGTFTASHKLRVWINAVEYDLSLDAV